MKFIDNAMIALGCGILGGELNLPLDVVVGATLILLGVVNRFVK